MKYKAGYLASRLFCRKKKPIHHLRRARAEQDSKLMDKAAEMRIPSSPLPLYILNETISKMRRHQRLEERERERTRSQSIAGINELSKGAIQESAFVNLILAPPLNKRSLMRRKIGDKHVLLLVLLRSSFDFARTSCRALFGGAEATTTSATRIHRKCNILCQAMWKTRNRIILTPCLRRQKLLKLEWNKFRDATSAEVKHFLPKPEAKPS